MPVCGCRDRAWRHDLHSLFVACARNGYRSIRSNRYVYTHDRYYERCHVQRASLEGVRGSVPKHGSHHAYFHKVIFEMASTEMQMGPRPDGAAARDRIKYEHEQAPVI